MKAASDGPASFVTKICAFNAVSTTALSYALQDPKPGGKDSACDRTVKCGITEFWMCKSTEKRDQYPARAAFCIACACNRGFRKDTTSELSRRIADPPTPYSSQGGGGCKFTLAPLQATWIGIIRAFRATSIYDRSPVSRSSILGPHQLSVSSGDASLRRIVRAMGDSPPRHRIGMRARGAHRVSYESEPSASRVKGWSSS